MIKSKKLFSLVLCLFLIFSNITTAFSFNENANQNPSVSVEVASGTLSDLNINLDEFTFIDDKYISIYNEEDYRQRNITLPAGIIAIASAWHSPTSMTILIYNMTSLYITDGGIEGIASMYNGKHYQYKKDFIPVSPGGLLTYTINSPLGDIKSVSYNCVVYMPESTEKMHYLSGNINKPF